MRDVPRPLCIITSAGYVGEELAAEFGRLPSAFLPVGVRRIFEYQLALLDELDAEKVISIPEDFAPCEEDARLLESKDVRVVKCPSKAGLGASLLRALSELDCSRAIYILHGDTLFMQDSIDFGKKDVFSVSEPGSAVQWGVYGEDEEGLMEFWNTTPGVDQSGARVLSGYFHFEDGRLLKKSLEIAAGFLKAISVYAMRRHFKPMHVTPWLDFGHTSTFYQSRRHWLSARRFNKVRVENRVFSKTGENSPKLEAEAAWFETLPAPLRLYVPQFLGSEKAEDGRFTYRLAYLPYPSLAELWVFGAQGAAKWRSIFGACQTILSALREHAPILLPEERERVAALQRDKLIGGKTRLRVEEFMRTRGWDMRREWRINGHPVPCIDDIIERLSVLAARGARAEDVGILHGDFCFSNIVYDLRTDSVFCFDPRGSLDEQSASPYGCGVYDVAKLAHSVIGMYDQIIAGRFGTETGSYTCMLTLPESSVRREAGEAFAEMHFGGVHASSPEVLAQMILLFLSMTPLHGESPVRQDALFANALRLFLQFEQGLV